MKIRKFTPLLFVFFLFAGVVQVMAQPCAVITNPVITFNANQSTFDYAVVDFEFDATFNGGSTNLFVNIVDAVSYNAHGQTVFQGGKAPSLGDPIGFNYIRGFVGIDNQDKKGGARDPAFVGLVRTGAPIYPSYLPYTAFDDRFGAISIEVTGTAANPHYKIKGIRLKYTEGYTIPLNLMVDVWASQAGNFGPQTQVSCVVTGENLTVLPIKLSEFSVVKSGNAAQLTWTTATEQDNIGFDIERSADGQSWQGIGQVATKAVDGNSSMDLNYRFTDENPLNGINYYRLKQTDLDGLYSYSEVKTVAFDNLDGISLYPNPMQNSTTVKGLKGTETIIVFDVSGRQVIRQKAHGRQAEIDLTRSPQGVYHVQVLSQEGKIVRTLSVVKAK